MDKILARGIVTARKCSSCDHHEIGITTDSGGFIPLKPGMVVGLIQGRSEPVTKDEALNILNQYLANRNVEIYSISETLPSGCHVYGMPVDKACWYIKLPYESHHGSMLQSSRLICIAMDTGEVICDGSCGDEG